MTIVARAPVRLSFGGGGTDLPAYYARHGGFVVSAAIARYAVVVASPSPDEGIGVNSADYRAWRRWPAGVVPDLGEPLPLPRAALAWFAEQGLLPNGVDLFLAAEVPPGSGLGSSGAMAVAVCRALAAFAGVPDSPAAAAELACEIEIGRLGRPIGKQDQYAAAFGGLNAITFARDGVQVEPLALPPGVSAALEARLLLCWTGRCRDSASILTEQNAATGRDADLTRRLHRMKALAGDMRAALERSDLDGFGTLLDEGWRLKRGVHRAISSDAIDRWYALARDAGALGGKIAGAGGGGFLLLYVPPAARAAVVEVLSAEGLAPLAFAIDDGGATVAAIPDGAAVSAV